MNKLVEQWISALVAERHLEAPIVEYGARRSRGDAGCFDLRSQFTGMKWICCDMKEGPGVDVVDDVERSRFGPGAAGTVICLDTLSRVKRPWLAVNEAFRILKPGGVFIASVPFASPVRDHQDDYWRMTARGLEALVRSAGFGDVEASYCGEVADRHATPDGREEPIVEFHHPRTAFVVARKPAVDSRSRLTPASLPSSTARPGTAKPPAGSGPVPIVVPVFHREEETRRMFAQLARVTDRYSVVVVNNGFDDLDFLRGLGPRVYVENEENNGAIAPINQGLDEVDDEFVAVLHNDLLIYDEGWLDHIIEFMRRRTDVGLVGLAGRHSIKEDGSLDLKTTVVDIRGYPACTKPYWRLTEVAAIDGLGWVMRNIGLRLDESLGLMHFYDLDLSLQYIQAGYRVYVAGVDIFHLGDDPGLSTRSREAYLDRIGGDDDRYYDEVRERFRLKWQHMLPITRGFNDEARAYALIDQLTGELATAEKERVALEEYVYRLEEEHYLRGAELERAKAHFEQMDRLAAQSRERIAALEAVVGEPEAGRPSVLARLRRSLKSEGLLKTVGKAFSLLLGGFSDRS